MYTILDVDDAFLSGKNLVEDWEQEFERDYNEPVLSANIGRMLQSIPNDTKAMIREKIGAEKFDRTYKKYGV